MKILMPYVDVAGNDISNKKVSGGTELFSRLIKANFDVVLVDIPWTTDRKQNEHYRNLIKQEYLRNNCDVVLSNNFKSVCFYAIRDLGFPIMHITHTNYGLAKANHIINDVESCGHSIFGVSQYNIDYHQNKSRRLGIPEINYSGFLAPAYCSYDLPIDNNPTNNVVTVGRANTYKAPFSICKKLTGTKYNPTVITGVGVDEDSIEYYEKNKHQPHYTGLDHSDVMQHLRSAVCSVITCTKETFGIAALESLSVGTPVLIRTSETGEHASTEIAASCNHYVTYDVNSKTDEMLEKIDQLSKSDRAEIKQMTQEKHSQIKWVRSYSNAFDMTIEKYKKHSKAGLDQFF